MRTSLAFALFMLLGLSHVSWARSDSKPVASKKKKERGLKAITSKKVSKASKAQKKNNALILDQSDMLSKDKNWSVFLSYSLSFDENQKESPKTRFHNLNANFNYTLNPNWSLYASVSTNYQTEKSYIVRASDQEKYYNFSDPNVGATHVLRLKSNKYLRRITNSFNYALPFSETSRLNQSLGRLSLSHLAASTSWHNFLAYTRFRQSFHLEQLKYRPSHNGALNYNYSNSIAVGLTYIWSRYFGIRASLSYNNTRYLDGLWERNFGNGITLFSNIQGVNLFLSFSNRSYAETANFQYNFYDQYKQLISMGVSYGF